MNLIFFNESKQVPLTFRHDSHWCRARFLASQIFTAVCETKLNRHQTYKNPRVKSRSCKVYVGRLSYSYD